MKGPEVEVYTNAEEQRDEDAAKYDISVIWYAASNHNIGRSNTQRRSCHTRS